MIVDAAVYKDGKRVAKWGPDEGMPSEGFVWVALHNPSGDELAPFAKVMELHELAVEDVVHGEQMPKIEEYGDDILVAARQYKIVGNEMVESEMFVLAGAKYVLTVRKGDGEGLSQARRRAEKEHLRLSGGPSHALYTILDTVVDRYFPMVDALEREAEAGAALVFENEDESIGRAKTVVKKLYDVKKKVNMMRHGIGPLMDATSGLFGRRVPELCEGAEEYFRDIHDHLLRIQSSLDALSDGITSSLQTCLALITVEESVVVKKLASWASIFAVATCMVGVWGMNFKNMPELEWTYGYPIALSSVVIVGAILRYRFRKSGWL